MTEKLAIFDYSDVSIHIYTIKNSECVDTDDTEELLYKLGHNINNCTIMWGENNINVTLKTVDAEKL